MKVQDFMTTDPITCEWTDTAQSVAELMRDKGVGFVVVLREGRVAGVITDRQLAVGVLAEGLSADAIPAVDIMSDSPATVRPEDSVFALLDTLRSAGVVRRVPVVDADKRLVGVVSVSDVAVVAKDLIDALLLEETRHTLREARVPTGGKRLMKEIRSPAKAKRPR